MKQTTKAKILIIITLCVLSLVIYRTIGTIQLISSGIKTEGIVIGHFCEPMQRFSSTGSVWILCTLKVTYSDKDKKKYIFETDTLVSEESYPKGTTVNVIYDKNHKLNANINSFKPLWLINLLGFIFCSIFLGLAYLGLQVYKDE